MNRANRSMLLVSAAFGAASFVVVLARPAKGMTGMAPMQLVDRYGVLLSAPVAPANPR